jgi:hypothetical protein
MNKIITRIKGGLGNQLFCYAAARRLALVNHAELVIDDVTGFVRDRQYYRRYLLDRFNIAARRATPAERLEPLERYRRAMMKWSSRLKPFDQRHYLEQEGLDFDSRLLTLKVMGSLYLDGLWQSEGYFKDVEQAIRQDLRIIPPVDAANQLLAQEISHSHSVAVHVRWFDAPGSMPTHNVNADYYRRAIAMMEEKIDAPRYFIFSDNAESTRANPTFPKGRVTFVTQNRGDENAYADLWLMSQCQHFITANSTFSWWGAWLSCHEGKIVITPGIRLKGITAWGFPGLLPESWIKIL